METSEFDVDQIANNPNPFHHSLHQFFNGWCQNINPYDQRLPLGKYFNLDRCG
jgi:hypothetical protein